MAQELKSSTDEEKSSAKCTEISILCFGDSLTAGYTNFGMQHIPYSHFLQELIEKDYAKSIKLKIMESGVDGELVVNSMLNRISEILKKETFDIVLFLGGTNDVGHRKPTKEICTALQKIYDCIETHKSQWVAVTVPPCKFTTPSIDEERNEVNTFIRKQASVVDLFEHVKAMNQKEKEAFFDKDGLHFSAAGYASFAQLLHNKIKPFLDAK
eukprot:CAMPEP_0197026724 /NCGR_PEP_ID=MMETSP1384-20130603/6757_1 /TAXON_ID=29189 /ORGANISM="Ammonia sp." /LENGTH=211 /DNA_ID=CAMNT_0042455443 /DNA_START=35 /DNA_END=667 /DNA_ORIENTATION=+